MSARRVLYIVALILAVLSLIPIGPYPLLAVAVILTCVGLLL